MMLKTDKLKPLCNNTLPSDWKVKILKDICIKIQDGNYGGDYPKQEEFLDFGIPFLTSKAIGGEGEIILQKIDYISIEKHEQLQKAQLKLHDVLFTNRGANVGTIGLVDERIAHGNIGPQLTLLRPKAEIIFYLFLKEAMKSFFVQSQIRSQDSGSAMNFFGIGDTSKFKLHLPPLPEQRAIAHVLSLMDSAINQNNQLIAQKELRKKWLMQNLLTGKKRLKGFCGEWKKERLEKYLVKHDEKSTSSNQYPVLTSSRRGIFLQSEYYTRDVASEDNTGYNVVPRGYFTYRHMSDDLIFKFNINDIVDKGIVSTLYPVFTVKNIDQYFLLCKLNEGNEFKIHAQEQKQGGSRTYVYFKTLCQLKLNIPSLEEQTAIAQVLQAADKEIQLLKSKTDKLREQKKGMMQALLTGKKRLNLNLNPS